MLRRVLNTVGGQTASHSVRFCSKDITGAHQDIPPWVKDKLYQDGYTQKQIEKQGWKNLDERALSTGPARTDRFARYQHFQLNMEYIRAWRAQKKRDEYMNNQSYDIVRHLKLGGELSAAKFLVDNGAAVKFHHRDDWVFMGSELEVPDKYNESFSIEAIDMREFKIVRRGFDNLAKLENLKSIKIANLDTVDDWCMDFISGTFNETLEYIDVSKCPNITERGLSVLHRCRQLETIYMVDMPNVNERELLTMQLEDVLPRCRIVGVDYWESEEAKALMEQAKLEEKHPDAIHEGDQQASDSEDEQSSKNSQDEKALKKENQ